MPTFDVYPVYGRAGQLVRFGGSGTFTVHDADTDALLPVTQDGGAESSTITADATGRLVFETTDPNTRKVRITDAKAPAITQIVWSVEGPKGDPGGVTSVNGQTGVVVLETGNPHSEYVALSLTGTQSHAVDADTSIDLTLTGDLAFSLTGTELGTVVGIRVHPAGFTLTLPGALTITGTDAVTATAWRMAEGWIYSVAGSGATDPPDPGDTIPPVAGTLSSSDITDDGFTLTVTGASDESALHALPYSFSTDNGASWSAWQASPVFIVTGKDPSTGYTCVHTVRDNADPYHETQGSSILVTTSAAPETFGLEPVSLPPTSDESDQTTYNFSAATFQFGTASPSRRIIAAILGRKAAPSATVSSVTIGGVAAVFEGRTEVDGTTVEIWSADLPTGTSGAVSVTWSTTMLRCNIHLYRMVGAAAGVIDTTSATGSAVATLDSTSVAGGGMLAISASLSGSATVTWTGLTPDGEIGNTVRSATAHTLTTGASQPATVGWSASGTTHLAVTYGPAA